jgi:hypothetical protein
MEQTTPTPKAMLPRKTLLYGAVLVVMVLAWTYLVMTARQTSGGSLTIGEDIRLHVDIAATPAARAQGLSGRASLGEDEGMLFLFPAPGQHQFWMKDMLFPLDFLWIREGRIIDMSVDVQPPSPDGDMHIVSPFEPADTVLEVRAGFAAAHGLRTGLPVTWAVDR